MFAACALLLVLGGCATWQAPASVDDAALRGRAVTAVAHGVRLSAAVLSAEDSRQMFGADVNAKGVQPVWVEVENGTTGPLFLLRTGIDPDYFSPLEVAWSFHAPMSSTHNAALDEHFDTLGFQNPIWPDTTRTGVVFANPHLSARLLNVDLLGDDRLIPFTLFLPIPDDADDEDAEALVARYVDTQAVNYLDPGAFRAALERLPCCATGSKDRQVGDPLNVVLVGSFADVATAVVRRGFRRVSMRFDNAQQLFGRPPDIVVRKSGQGGMPAHWMRIWVAPLRYQDQTVFVVQAGRPVGGRFAVAEGQDLVLHPDVDEVRNLLIQDLIYSGGLAKLGFVTGVGQATVEQPRQSIAGTTYYTDGVRAVMFFTTRPRALSEWEVLDWIPLPEPDAAGATPGRTDERP